MSLLVIVPCMAGLIILGKPVIRTLFEHGRFGPEDTEITWQALLFLSPALVAFSLRPILARTCYALKKNWILFRYELFGFIANLILDYILIKHMGISGVALATTIVVSIMGIYLIVMLSKTLGKIDFKDMKLFSYKVLLAAVLMGIWTYFSFTFIGGYGDDGYKTAMLKLMFTIISSGLCYFLILRVLRLEELKLLWETMKKSIAKD